MAERPVSAVTSDTVAAAANTPLPAGDDTSFFREPRAPFLGPDSAESPRDSYRQSTPNDSADLLAAKNEPAGEEPASLTSETTQAKRRPLLIFLAALAALIVVVLAVILPVYFTVIKPKNNDNATAVSPTSTVDDPATPTATGTTPPAEPVSGFDGSTVRATDGSTFNYVNNWDDAVNLPSACVEQVAIFARTFSRASSVIFISLTRFTPLKGTPTPMIHTATTHIPTHGRVLSIRVGTTGLIACLASTWAVGLFWSPSSPRHPFQRYPGATDEWSLSELMAADTANGGLNQLEEHYRTFITEQDIAEIAGAGLNWVRLPIPFWAIDKLPDEPYLEKTSWKYIVQAFQWCRKYGIRIKLDLHAIPGSQSGYNHSGKSGQINFMMGTMGIANAQRALNYIRIITEFISQPEWRDVVPMFGIMNEARITDIGEAQLRGFYVEAYKMIRGITGIGEGKGPFISLHDGFQGLERWEGFLQGGDRIAIDRHPYFAFSGGPATSPIDTGTGPTAGGTWVQAACQWGATMNVSRNAFGVTLGGEWSNGFNDCGLFLTGVGGRQSYGGDCADWQDSSNWTPGTKAGLMRFTSATMDALRDFFFWTWKIGPSTRGIVESPLWSYQLGLRNGWMPTDPRTAIGTCGSSTGPQFDQSFEPWMTGGVGAGSIGPAQTAQYPFPPAFISNAPVAASNLPMYTPTGAISTLSAPTYTGSTGNTIPAGNGWFNPNDNAPAPTPISGCVYPDAWDAWNLAVPSGCTGTPIPPAAITPPPSRR
ncbi:hypothetical protein NLJ89_g4596 [Agrocybe chaxingu]|uniref:glucan 1,3-beta-glucosidase n=1 Tax=Agrocybe chaxingu TaxID=84603 RepID=A0A9W8MXW4_9AGAR|nr:hypothetical protein NLJ89_g4596 [Agrocybe chaxingu]